MQLYKLIPYCRFGKLIKKKKRHYPCISDESIVKGKLIIIVSIIMYINRIKNARKNSAYILLMRGAFVLSNSK